MEPTELYQQLYPLFIKDIKSEIAASKERDQVKVSAVPYHTHNGVDSPQFPFSNIKWASKMLAVQYKTLTSAQIKSLFTVPITLVPAPVFANTAGSGTNVKNTFNQVVGIAARLTYTGTAYTGANALEFRYTNGSGAKVTADISTTFLNSASSTYAYVSGVTTELVPVANSPIVVFVPVGSPGTGSSNITFVVYYRVISFNT